MNRVQQTYLEYKAHAFTPGPMLLRHRTLTKEKADIILDVNVKKLKDLKSIVTEKMAGCLELVDSREYNVAEFGDYYGPSRSYLEGLLGPSVSDSRIVLELLYRANLSCDLWEGVIIAKHSSTFHEITQQQVTWKPTGSKHAPWAADHEGHRIVACIGCFPDEYLYHIIQESDELGQMNDWPARWSREYEGGVSIDIRRSNVFQRLASEQRQGEWAISDSRLDRKYLISESEEKAEEKKHDR